MHSDSLDEAVEATLTVSRALLGVIATSLTDALHEITLPQFRVLVVLSTAGPMRIGAVAEKMKANTSTFSRTIDRMVGAGWVDRAANADSRREVLVQITTAGRALVDRVTERRRIEIAAILSRVEPAERAEIVRALTLFAQAAGEPAPENLLVLGT